MDFSYRYHAGALVILPEGEIDQHSVSILKTEVDQLIGEGNARELCFDLSRVTFMDSSGIGFLIGRYKKMAAAGGRVTLCGVQPQVDRVLSLSGIDQIIEKVRR